MYFSQWLIVYSYAKSIYDKRNKFTSLNTILLFAGLLLTYKFLTTIEIFNLLFTLLCNILCFYIGFKSTFKSALFHGLILTITQFVSEVVAIYIISLLSGSPNTSYTENLVIYVTDVILSKVLYFLISRFLLRFSIKESSAKSWGRWFSLAILPLSSLFMIIVFRLLTNGQKFSLTESVLCMNKVIIFII